ncbi:MAG: thermonuclease family protein [Planctomycetes bacterium]|nr:thermonuclease family protein [Planctomycetota bacterium]
MPECIRLARVFLFGLLLAGTWEIPAWADEGDSGGGAIELRSGDRVEIRMDSRGRARIVLVRAARGAEREEFDLKTGEERAFVVGSTLPDEEEARVVRVLDGDTLVVELHGKEERVRLLGVDTPEIFGDFYSVEAWHRTSSLVQGKTVRLVYEERRTDDLGRVLCFVYVGERCLNHILLQEGFGFMPDRTDQALLPSYERLRSLESEAKNAKRGLWDEAKARLWATAFVRQDHYVASKTTFHRPECPHAQGLAESDRFRTIEEALAKKRTPCTKCLPTRNYEPPPDGTDD